MTIDPLSPFHPLVRKWFYEHVGTPTDIQERAWPLIASGEHVLVTAPTGSGKTLAAFLWAIDGIVTGRTPAGVPRVLYLSPLKALNNDIRKNLTGPLESLRDLFRGEGEPFPDIQVMTRSGDTPQNDRRRMTRRPPEILITTPESLNIMLSSAGTRQLLAGIRTVIMDEVHAVAGTKRGTHMITAVDRITLYSGEFQRISLSATVNPAERVADYTGGYRIEGDPEEPRYLKRDVRIIRSADRKTYSIRVAFPDDALETMEDGTWWPALTRAFVEIIKKGASTLFFGNSRRTVERVTRFINERDGSELAWAHHGSLSREIRLAVEERLKRGDLKAIVATSSLELGIDIGELDRVVLIGTPGSVMSTVQRIGRAGHGVGQESRGVIYPLHGRDFLDAAVMARAVMEGDVEELHPADCPLDVLAQVILSMTASVEWNIDLLYAFLKGSYPYRNLPRRHYDLVLAMLEGRYGETRIRELAPRVSIDRVSGTVVAREGTRYHLFTSGGTIPDRGQYAMRLAETKAKIGELDEEFVWERTVGETFTFGTGTWRIMEITHNDVLVAPAVSAPGIIPFWKGEEMNRDFHLSERVALFLEDAQSLTGDELFRRLVTRHCMEDAAALELAGFLERQRECTGTPLPHRHHLLIEHVNDPASRTGMRQVILHTMWGGRINSPFAHALAQAWRERYGYQLEVICDNDCISLMLPHDFDPGHVFGMVTPVNVEGLLRRVMESTGFFGARFRENAGRALLLPRGGFHDRMPLWMTRLRSRKLFDAVLKYDDFPVLLETWRECMQDDYDIINLKMLLDEISDGRITLSECASTVPSPFCGGLVWKQTNRYMYQDDTPAGGGRSAMADDLIREITGSSRLRPSIPRELVLQLRGKLHRIATGYSPSTPRDLVDWVKERLLVPADEWSELLQAMERDHGLEHDAVINGCRERLAMIRPPGAVCDSVCAVENIARIRRDLAISPDALVPVSIADEACGFHGRIPGTGDSPGQGGAEDLVHQWLSYYGPVTGEFIAGVLGTGQYHPDLALARLVEEGRVLSDRFTTDAACDQLCERENLESLLRMLRRSRRQDFTALEAPALQLFLASWIGPAAGFDGIDGLRDVLDHLFICPAPAAAWEEYILPARLKPYHTTWLDALTSSSGLAWYGCGVKKTTFAFPEDRELFSGYVKKTGTEEAAGSKLFPDPRARYSFFDTVRNAGEGTASVFRQLWALVWQGQAANDSFATLRRGILAGFEPWEPDDDSMRAFRSSYNRWEATRPVSGSWYLLPGRDEGDPLEEEDIRRERVRLLLKRYGILFRELLERELPPMRWSLLFRTLRVMELSGELVTGHFFHGIGGLQFMSPAAFRALTRGLDHDRIYWINAADPASLCGTGVEGLDPSLPSRHATSFIVFHGMKPVVILRRGGRDVTVLVRPDHPLLDEYLCVFRDLLNRDFNPPSRISIESMNGVKPAVSEFRQAFISSGFVDDYSALSIRRRY